MAAQTGTGTAVAKPAAAAAPTAAPAAAPPSSAPAKPSAAAPAGSATATSPTAVTPKQAPPTAPKATSPTAVTPKQAPPTAPKATSPTTVTPKPPAAAPAAAGTPTAAPTSTPGSKPAAGATPTANGTPTPAPPSSVAAKPPATPAASATPTAPTAVTPKQQQPQATPGLKQRSEILQRKALTDNSPKEPLFPVPDPRTFGTKVPDRIQFDLVGEANDLVKIEIAAIEAEREFEGIVAKDDAEGKVLNQNAVAGHAVANLLLRKLANVSTVITRADAKANTQIFREQGPRSVDWRLPLSQETLKYLASMWLYRFAFQYVSQQRSAGGAADGSVLNGSYVRQQLAYFTTQNEPWSQKVGVVMTDWLTRFIANGQQSYLRLDSVMRKSVKLFGRLPSETKLVKENGELTDQNAQLQEQVGQILGALRGYQTELSGEAQSTGQAIDWLKDAEERERQAKAERADTVIRAVAPSAAAVQLMVYLARDAPIIQTVSAMAEDARPNSSYTTGGSLFAPSASLVSLMVGLSEGGLRGANAGIDAAGVSPPSIDMTDVPPSAWQSGSAAARSREETVSSSVFPSSALVGLVQLLLADGGTGQGPATGVDVSASPATVLRGDDGTARREELAPKPAAASLASVFPSSSLISLVQLLLLPPPPVTEATTGSGTMMPPRVSIPERSAQQQQSSSFASMAALFPSSQLVSSMVTLRDFGAPPRLAAIFPNAPLLSSSVTYAEPEAPRPVVIVQRAGEPEPRATDPRTVFPSPDFVQTMALMARRVRDQ